MQTITIHEDDDGIRLDRWFKRHYPQITQGELQKMLRKKLVRLDGKRVETNAHVQAGQSLRLPDMDISAIEKKQAHTLSRKEEEVIQALRRAILYEDAGTLVLNKPSGLAVQGGSKVRESVDGVLDAFTDKQGRRPKLVHRLDRDTSGVLLLGKTPQSTAELTKAFRHKDAEKTYLALIKGVPSMDEGEINLPLAKDGAHKEKMVVDKEEGKHALTRYRLLERVAQNMAWVALYPLTGRTHQLRVHMAAIGHPIVADGKYGGSEAYVEGIAPHLHLHAWHIHIPGAAKLHPVDVWANLHGHMKETASMLDFHEREWRV